MTLLDVVRWFHLVAVAVWLGGLITLWALVVALRKAGAERALLQAAARQFGRLSWSAMLIAVVTGLWQVHLLGLPWTYGRLHVKLGLVGLVIGLALYHQFTARNSSPAARGVVQAVVLLLSLGIYVAAVSLRG